MHDVAKPVPTTKPARAPRRARSIIYALSGVIGIFVLIVGIKVMQIMKMVSTPFAVPPTTVSSVTAKEEDWPPILSSVGSVSATQGAVVATELGGVVRQGNFQNGGVAKKGDILISLDASSEEAQLHTSEAELELARANLQRTRDLAARKVVSKSELDAGESAFAQKQGSVDNM